jgi:hypothetical protein
MSEIKNISYIGFDDSCWVEMVCIHKKQGVIFGEKKE